MTEFELKAIAKGITLSDIIHMYNIENIKRDVDVIIKDINLLDYDFNNVFNNKRCKIMHRSVLNIKDISRREWCLKLLYKIDSL